MTRIALVSPAPLSAASGNVTTLRRIARGLRAAGLEVLEIGEGGQLGEGLAALERGAGLERLRGASLVHAFHAFKTGPAAREAARRLGVPYAVSITGTDLSDDLRRPERRDAVLSVLRDAGAVLCSSLEARGAVLAALGGAARCVVVPKGVEAPEAAPPCEPLSAEPFSGEPWRAEPCRAEPSCPEVRFLLVAGWREVKNNLFPLEPLARLAAEVPGLRLRFVGPVLDPGYHGRWLEARGRYPFAEEAGPVPPERMDEEYRRADVVLNASHSEGGSNAVLEAMARSRPVLASSVPGNRAFLQHHEAAWELSTGVLYRAAPLAGAGPDRREHDGEDFYVKALRLALEPELRRRIGRNAREHVLREHSPRREIEGVLEAYRLAGVLGAPPP
ncbi:MAG: glycosyltransferase family 4 protein [Planctomycetes bacterium]|nr:glycosyltransferase family 4 protein [Planctomycetota bacterium]